MSNQYHKVFDGRKRRIRGLWGRNDLFYAQASLPDESGVVKVRRVRLTATTVAGAAAELRRLMTRREEEQLPLMTQAPKFDEYAEKYIETQYALGRKTLETLKGESRHVRFWAGHLRSTRLNRITTTKIRNGLIRRKGDGLAPRTINICLISLRNVLKMAIQDGWLKVSPAAPIEWQKVPRKKWPLFSSRQLDELCKSALRISANGPLFCDFVRFLCYSGARVGEALPLSWADVDWKNGQITIGAGGDTKNREFRVVDFNPSLRSHLESMLEHRTQDLWLFLSAQRGRQGHHASCLRGSLLMARNDAALQHVRFHDCRHHFISYCVMSGIDFMTIAKWVGHKDGGMLIGRTYGHLADEHTKRAAQKVSFG
jgi:integrase